MIRCERCPCAPDALCPATADPANNGWICSHLAAGTDHQKRHAAAFAVWQRPGSAGTADETVPIGEVRHAQRCPHRDCGGCGCGGCRCGPGGKHAGQLVTIRDCLECVSAA